MMMLIGSHALNYYVKEKRVPKDYDLIATYEEYENFVKSDRSRISHFQPIRGDKFIVRHKVYGMMEFSIAWPDSNDAKLLHMYEGCCARWKLFDNFALAMVPPLDVLYALKLSHRYLKNAPSFRKTMDDIKTMRKLGCDEIPGHLREWYMGRERETYAYSHPKLNQGKDTFFSNDGVEYIYDHDSIHQAVKVLYQPAYMFYQDGAEVKCSKELWDKQPYDVKVYGVLEESLVLALERSQIPNGFTVFPERSFKQALEKVCTSITSGWFREFAWENYDAVCDAYDVWGVNYVDRFKKALDSGIIKPYK